MKRIISLLLAFILCFSTVPTANAQSKIDVIINGKNLSFDVAPQMINGRVLVPMRTIFEAMGATVDYDQDSQTITADKGDKKIVMQVGSTTISVSGAAQTTIDVAPIIRNSRTLVPIRAISESLNADVEWNDVLNKVLIFDWDTIKENIIKYDQDIYIPDFGKYVGLESNSVNKIDSENYSYTYTNNLGTNKAAILADYENVLEKVGFKSGYIDKSTGYMAYEEQITDDAMKQKMQKAYLILGAIHGFVVELPSNLEENTLTVNIEYFTCCI